MAVVPASYQRSLCWFRRDLRDFDHAALCYALQQSEQVLCVFVFDSTILASLHRDDRRVSFIWHAVAELDQALRQQGSALCVVHGDAKTEIPRLAAHYQAQAVFCNHDDDPSAIARDHAVAQTLATQGCAFFDAKDHVIFERAELLTQAGKPFSVFTPYKNSWLKNINTEFLQSYPVEHYRSALWQQPHVPPLPSVADLGFVACDFAALHIKTGMRGGEQLWADFLPRMSLYKQARDFPAVKGVSYLSAHVRFGTVSIRQLARTAFEHGGEGAEGWLNELIWRDFYQQILYHRPDVASGHSFKAEYEGLVFPGEEAHFVAWSEGRTGYPIVDAAMRQLQQVGWMHNRLRMITASFLVKDLLIDWRKGEAHFARWLLDYDLAANNGGWQWAASTGCDAQPYFRIFNPITQSQKFDPKGQFIRRYVPELANLDDKAIHAPWQAKQLPLGFRLGRDYPHPIVDHAAQRLRALALFERG